MNTVFISYETTTGLSFARHLKKSLNKHEISSFVAEKDIEPGTASSQIIQENIRECKFFVLILTITALKSPEVKKEFSLARKLNKDIIPCIKSGLEEYIEDECKDMLDFQYIQFETKEELANNVVEALLKKEISNLKGSLRRLKTVTRREIVDSLLSDLVSAKDEIYIWLTEPNVDPNEEYVLRTPIKIFENAIMK